MLKANAVLQELRANAALKELRANLGRMLFCKSSGGMLRANVVLQELRANVEGECCSARAQGKC